MPHPMSLKWALKLKYMGLEILAWRLWAQRAIKLWEMAGCGERERITEFYCTVTFALIGSVPPVGASGLGNWCTLWPGFWILPANSVPTPGCNEEVSNFPPDPPDVAVWLVYMLWTSQDLGFSSVNCGALAGCISGFLLPCFQHQ